MSSQNSLCPRSYIWVRASYHDEDTKDTYFLKPETIIYLFKMTATITVGWKVSYVIIMRTGENPLLYWQFNDGFLRTRAHRLVSFTLNLCTFCVKYLQICTDQLEGYSAICTANIFVVSDP